MKGQINQLLIRVLHEYIAGPKELVQFLLDTLDISRESAHRRLRNEIMFTFEEVCKIAQSLALSVDRLIGVNHAGTAFFDLYMHKSSDPIKIFTEILQVNTDLIIKTQHELPLRINIVLNRLPFGFTLVHENLAKFYYYKWLFHIQEPYSYVNFDEFVIPDQILDCYKKYIEASYNIVGDVIILLDENIFISKIKEINYFRRRGLISNDKIYEIRKELLLVVDMLEYMTQHGNYKSQTNISIYLSSVDLEPSYMHMEYGDKSCA